MIQALITLSVSFLFTLILYRPFIRLLRRLKAGQVIQEELPDAHQRKAGTPTAGGALFALAGVIAGVLAVIAGHPGALPAVAGLVAGGLLGFADDRAKLRLGARGIPARLKLPIQVVLAIPVAAIAIAQGVSHQLWLGPSLWITFPLAVCAIVGTANAVNITDGIDGLAAGLSLIAIATLALLPPSFAGEQAVAFALCGGLAAFLLFNRFPARIFMGDTGALALGYGLASMAIQQGYVLLLPLVGLVFALETLSVIIQVAYFKASRGQRVFPNTPIHLTFHQGGWSENRIALSFWGVGALSALAAFAVAQLNS